jgi:hypothetical protein
VLAGFFLAPFFAPAPRTTPVPAGLLGAPPARMTLAAQPLGFDPDGNARWLVLTKFFDSQGNPTLILANSDFSWTSRDGRVQWQTRMRFGQPAAILITNRDGPLRMRVHANQPKLGTLTVRTDTRRWPQPRVVGEALGPRAVSIGWFPRERYAVRVDRFDARGRRTRTIVSEPSSAFLDTTVAEGSAYRYAVYRRDRRPVVVAVETPAGPPRTSIANVYGKGMWLFFTDNPVDDIYYAHLDPNAIVAQAVRAGLHYVELRFTYGAYWEVAPQAKPTVDAIVDGLAAHGIGTIAWTVPRDRSFEDVAASVRAAYYRTSNGTPVRGLAIDVERGDDFMGDAPEGLAALWQYVALVRQALGPRYLIVTNVEDPYLEHLDEASYPYAQIARASSVLQPMAYWAMVKGKTTPAQVRAILRASFSTVRREAGSDVPISMGGQTAAGPAGPPGPTEILASLEVSRKIGALGECFFAWNDTRNDQWEALGRYPW